MLAYDKAWAALNMLIREGRSFSGHERNCAYLNLGARSDRFANVSAVTGLDFDDDGRGLAYSDWDGDGDLDLWLTNRTGPRVRFLRNDSPASDRSIAFYLRGTNCNRDAIGARVVLKLRGPRSPLQKTLRAGHGHLSQSSKWIHFGLGDASPENVEVRWPGGDSETFHNLRPGGRYVLVQGDVVATRADPPGPQNLVPSQPESPPTSDAGRIVLLKPAPVPELRWQTLDGETRSLDTVRSPVLLNLWATWCTPCAAEMKRWAESAEKLSQNELEIIAVSVDEPNLPAASIRAFAENLGFPFAIGRPADDLIEKLETLQRSYIGRQSDLPIPSSFLVDQFNQLVAIYRGPLSDEQLLADLNLLGASPEAALARAVPFEGRWIGAPKPTEAKSISLKFLHRGHPQHALDYAHRLVNIGRENSQRFSHGEVLQFETLIGGIHYDLKEYDKAVEFWTGVLEVAPADRTTRLNLARAHNALGQSGEAIHHLRIALNQRRQDPENLTHLARFVRQQGDLHEAAELLRESNELAPSIRVQFELGETLAALGDIAGAAAEFRGLLQRQPDWPPAANNLAWILSASPDTSLRDPSEALRLATVAAEACNYQRPYVVGTLAAAYAENGQFEKAVEYAAKAVELAENAGDEQAAKRIQAALEVYQNGRPYRDPALTARSAGNDSDG